MNGFYDGTIAQILALVGLQLKVMVASGDSDQEEIELMGDKTLGHRWKPQEDKLVFRISVNLSATRIGDSRAKIGQLKTFTSYQIDLSQNACYSGSS